MIKLSTTLTKIFFDRQYLESMASKERERVVANRLTKSITKQIVHSLGDDRVVSTLPHDPYKLSVSVRGTWLNSEQVDEVNKALFELHTYKEKFKEIHALTQVRQVLG
jgi:hypothetical protein